MKVGKFMMPLHPPQKNRTQTFEEDVECVLWAEELGFAEAWIGQHHTATWEPIPANDVFIAHVLPQTERIRLGTGVTIMTQHHPANVAVRLAYLDHLSKGRINVGFGQGGVPTDWPLFDLPDPRTQGLMNLEAMDIVMKLWTEDGPFEFKGDFWNVTLAEKVPELGLGEVLKPYQKPHPPIAMSIVKEESMAATTGGRRGFLPISINMAPSHKVKRHWEMYREGAAEGGRPEPDRRDWRISRSICVGETDAQAREHAINGAFADSLMYLRGMLEGANMLDLPKMDPGMSDAELTRDYFIDEIAIVGSPDTVTRKLQELYDFTGGFGTVLMIGHDWDDKATMKRSMELMAKEVIPRLP